MKSFLLLILSLMADCQVWYGVKGCLQGWVEFTCKYPTPNVKYTNIYVDDPREKVTESNKKDVWETEGNVSLFHDTGNKKLRVLIKHLEHEDFGKYQCLFYQQHHDCTTDIEELDLVDEKDGCQAPFIQTVYRRAKTTITCDDPGNTYKSRVKFFCKDNDFICEDILSTKSSLSKGTFTLTETNSGFNVSISDVSSQDAGVYWCGVESNEGRYRTALRKIQLKVEDITTFSRSPTAGQNFTYWCRYPNGSLIKKFICKGEDPSICQRVASTAWHDENTRFSMKDDKVKGNITITVREVTTGDTGTYWCGAESTAPRQSNPFFNRLLMTVVPSTASTVPSSTSSPSSTQPVTVASGGFNHGSVLPTAVAVSVDILLMLMFLFITYFVYKRFAPNTRREE